MSDSQSNSASDCERLGSKKGNWKGLFSLSIFSLFKKSVGKGKKHFKKKTTVSIGLVFFFDPKNCFSPICFPSTSDFLESQPLVDWTTPCGVNNSSKITRDLPPFHPRHHKSSKPTQILRLHNSTRHSPTTPHGASKARVVPPGRSEVCSPIRLRTLAVDHSISLASGSRAKWQCSKKQVVFHRFTKNEKKKKHEKNHQTPKPRTLAILFLPSPTLSQACGGTLATSHPTKRSQRRVAKRWAGDVNITTPGTVDLLEGEAVVWVFSEQKKEKPLMNRYKSIQKTTKYDQTITRRTWQNQKKT